MLNRLPAIAAAILAIALSAPAFAQSTSSDTMGHSTMSSGSSMGHMDTTKHRTPMTHDTTGNTGMSHDTMSHGSMTHGTMPKSQ